MLCFHLGYVYTYLTMEPAEQIVACLLTSGTLISSWNDTNASKSSYKILSLLWQEKGNVTEAKVSIKSCRVNYHFYCSSYDGS